MREKYNFTRKIEKTSKNAPGCIDYCVVFDGFRQRRGDFVFPVTRNPEKKSRSLRNLETLTIEFVVRYL